MAKRTQWTPWTQLLPVGGIDMQVSIEVGEHIFAAALEKLLTGGFAPYIDPMCKTIDDGRHRLVADVLDGKYRVSIYVPGINDDNVCAMYVLTGFSARLAKPGEDVAIRERRQLLNRFSREERT